MRHQAYWIHTLAAVTISWSIGQGMGEAQVVENPPTVDPLPTSIVSWGWDQSGKLGDGNPFADQTSPVAVTFREPKAISAGPSHALAIRGGGVWAWGNNDWEQLGGGSHWSCQRDSSGTRITACPTPVRVSGLSGVTAVSAGWVHNLALKSDHTVWAWGDSAGGLNSTTTRSATPVEVTGLITGTSSRPVYPTAVAAGSGFSMVRRSDGSVWAWGSDGWGQLGTGTGAYTDSATPVQVAGPIGSKVLKDVADIEAGDAHALARKVDGTVWAWGRADFLGDGPRSSLDFRSDRPVQVKVEIPNPFGGSTLQPLTDITAIAAGQAHSLALKSDGTVWAWGGNSDGQLGDDTYDPRNTAVQVIFWDPWAGSLVPLRDVVAIAAGRLHSLALRADGTVWAWGNNGDAYTFHRGHLGTGHHLDASRPTPEWVTDVVGAIAIAAGSEFSLAITCSTFATDLYACYARGDHIIEPKPIPIPGPIIVIR